MSRILFALFMTLAAPASPQVVLTVDGATICPTTEIRYNIDARRLAVRCDNTIFGDGFE